MAEGFNPRNYRVALLAGGTSGEREISLASGAGARAALEQAGFSVETLDPARPEDLKRLIDGPFDVAFLCLHGKYGEDGTMQGMLELLGIPYTGSGVWSSALAMNKTKSKWFYEREGIPTPASVTLHAGEDAALEEVAGSVGLPCVVKPAAAGSALGVFIVDNREALADALERAFELGDEVLVERYVHGTELTVAVVGDDDDVEALPIIEIVPENEFYDFESKYAPGGSRHICPAPLDDVTTALVQDYATRAHKALECRGASRSDFILEGDGACWILETNTIPGMTETSLLPDAARAAGVSFPDLCTRLVRIALRQRG